MSEKDFESSPEQAPAPSLDARGLHDLSDEEIADLEAKIAGRMLPHNLPMRWEARLLEEVKRRRAAPSATSDALRDRMVDVQTVARAALGRTSSPIAQKVLIEIDSLATAALAASPSVTREGPSCYACGVLLMVGPREVCESCARLSEEEQDDKRTEWAPAPTAPKEPQRCQRCGGRGTIPDMATASIRTDTLPPTIDCPDCAAESGAAPREETQE